MIFPVSKFEDLFFIMDCLHTFFYFEADNVILEFVKQLLTSASDGSGYQSLVAGVIEDVVNKERLVLMLKDTCLARASPYNYESKYYPLT